MVKNHHPDTWSVAEARAKFSELLRRASESPQTILNHGRPVATVVHPSVLEDLQKRARPSLLQASSEIREIVDEEGFELELPRRSDRDNPFEEMSDDTAG